MALFCKHQWEKVSETTLPSAQEQTAASMMKPEYLQPEWFYQKTHIVIMQCKNCGKIDKTVTTR